MLDMLKPLNTESLKQVCIKRFEELILSGKMPVGKKLPPERELATRLGVSRPVVHEALVEIAAKGLVSVIPRVGTVVNDFRKKGSLAMLTSLLHYHKGKLEPKFLESLLAMRMLFEKENAKLAARNRKKEHLDELEKLLKQEQEIDYNDIAQITEIDFNFHHCIAMSTDNLSYPLLLNSFKQFYTSLSGIFFRDSHVVPEVFSFHINLVNAVEKRDEKSAVEIMCKMLLHGEERLGNTISQKGDGYGHDYGE